jgi:hypothetical protein
MFKTNIDLKELPGREQRVRNALATRGWKIMRRRKPTSARPDQFWLMLGQPLTLEQIEAIPIIARLID